MAAGFVIGGSVGIVLTIAGQLSGLHSLETQEQVSVFLSEGPGSGLGMDLETALGWMRVILMVVAGCATAAAVLGVQVLRRSRGARKLLTLLAIPIFLGGFVAGGFLTGAGRGVDRVAVGGAVRAVGCTTDLRPRTAASSTGPGFRPRRLPIPSSDRRPRRRCPRRPRSMHPRRSSSPRHLRPAPAGCSWTSRTPRARAGGGLTRSCGPACWSGRSADWSWW